MLKLEEIKNNDNMKQNKEKEKEKSLNSKKIYFLEDECQSLEENIKELEKTFEDKKYKIKKSMIKL